MTRPNDISKARTTPDAATPDAHQGRHYITASPPPHPTACLLSGDGGGWAGRNVVTPLVGVRGEGSTSCRDKGRGWEDAGALCLSWWEYDHYASRYPGVSSCHQDKHKAPSLPHVRPLSLQDEREPFRLFHSSVANVHQAGYIGIISILIAVFALFSFPMLVSAHPLTGSGHIYGQLQDGTKHHSPVVGQSVTLQMAQGGNANDLMTVTTDAHGIFSFNALATDKTISYAVYTLYQKAQYVTNLIDLSSKPVQRVNLVVYDATDSTSNIAIVQANILIDKADAQHGLLTISESFFFENLGATTYVGSLQANGQKPNALRFSLPPGARQLSLKGGFDGYNLVQVDPGFASDAAIPPGTSQFAFSFQVPYSSSHYDFPYTIVYPTVVLAVLVPLDYHASSSVLTSQGTTNANQQTYQQLSAQQVLAGAEIHVELDGLPNPANSASSTSGSQNIPWFILIVGLMVAIVFATWFTYIRMQRRAARRKQTAKKGAIEEQSARHPIEPTAQRTASEQQEALLQELLALDKAYEAGTIKKADYQERRAKTKARLRTIISAEAGEQKTSTKKKAARSGGKARP